MLYEYARCGRDWTTFGRRAVRSRSSPKSRLSTREDGVASPPIKADTGVLEYAVLSVLILALLFRRIAKEPCGNRRP